MGWFNGTSISPNGSIQTVDSKSPAGCYDMSGNVWQWCHDWYGSYPSGSQTNPTGLPSGTWRVGRGGSYSNYNHYRCRSANRFYFDPTDYLHDDGGFRVARIASLCAQNWGETQIARWKNDAQGALSLTFDDNDWTLIQSMGILDQFGLKATFFVIAGQLMGSSAQQDMFGLIFNHGHELGSHTVNHFQYLYAKPQETIIYELSQSKYCLEAFTGVPCVVFAYPGGECEAQILEVAEIYYMSARTSSASLNYDACNLYLLEGSDRSGASTYTDEDFLARLGAYASSATSCSAWGINVFHYINSYNNSLNVTTTALTRYFQKLAAKEYGDLWVAPQGIVSRYFIERQSAAVEIQYHDAHCLIIRLNLSGDLALLNQPLTLLTKIPAAWADTPASIKQGDRFLPHAVRAKGQDTYLIYDALPGPDLIRITIPAPPQQYWLIK
ncbi:MAG: polysaccharide deacetylase family protein [Candidatus Sumerlaeota bacterium]|nr:polysaccharide deacetylase family protein [Candidatus Sumerlaeota bacterium]